MSGSESNFQQHLTDRSERRNRDASSSGNKALRYDQIAQGNWLQESAFDQLTRRKQEQINNGDNEKQAFKTAYGELTHQRKLEYMETKRQMMLTGASGSPLHLDSYKQHSEHPNTSPSDTELINSSYVNNMIGIGSSYLNPSHSEVPTNLEPIFRQDYTNNPKQEASSMRRNLS